VTSTWVWKQTPRETQTFEKDFKRLNKVATQSRITTSIGQYQMRKELALSSRYRLKTPKGPRRNILSESMPLTPDARGVCHGVRNRPPTPIAKVVECYYQNVAELDQSVKNLAHDTLLTRIQKFKGCRPHTRASMAASRYVRSSFEPKVAQELFKMTQFKNVGSRLGDFHVNPSR